MNSTGLLVATWVAGTVAWGWGVVWAAAYAFTERLQTEPRWKRPVAQWLLAVLLVVGFLALAYGASHMFDPVPR